VICPSGGLLTGVSSPVCKNISLHPSGKSSLQIRPIPPHQRGVGHRHERGEGCGGRGSVLRAMGSQGGFFGSVSDHRRADERCCCVRQNRVVLTPRRWRQVRGVASAQPGLDKTYPRMTVAKEPGHRGERDISRKTIACGNAGRFRCTRCYSCAFHQYKVHARPRVQRAPGIPHALNGGER
jgi:hypothetical protein